MKKLILSIIFLFLAINSQGNIRISVISQGFPSYRIIDKTTYAPSYKEPIGNVSVRMPFFGNIYLCGVPKGGSNSMISDPLFVTEDGCAFFDFTITLSNCAVLGSLMLRVTNSQGWDYYVPFSNNFHFSDTIPVNIGGDTVISIIIMPYDNSYDYYK